MATPSWLYACLLATVMVAGAMPTSAVFQAPRAAECIEGLASCCKEVKKTGVNPWRDPVTCSFTCDVGAELTIDVTSEDDPSSGTVDVWGSADCGGAHADCPKTPQTCTGASVKPATQADDDGHCEGDSNDFWASRTTIICVATVPELLDCNMPEGPDVEDLMRCGYTLTCDNLVYGVEDIRVGASYCTSGDPAMGRILCVYYAAGFKCYDLEVRGGLLGFILMEIGGGEAPTGLACSRNTCYSVEPTCASFGAVGRCQVGQWLD